jgi:endogenous inhibitor of DNA gyrase (YacG/DUF329 family)
MKAVTNLGETRGKGKICPICGKPATKADAPFCSRQCADIDLGRWLKGVYAIPAREAEGDNEDEPGAGGPPRSRTG